MIYIYVVLVIIGAVLSIGLFCGAVMAGISEFEFRSSCQGRMWRRAFPNAPKESIRAFPQVFVDAFEFPVSTRLTFSPDDQIMNIYKSLYPSRWIPDALELETFAKKLFELGRVRLESMWSEKPTLGEVFNALQAAQHDIASDGTQVAPGR